MKYLLILLSVGLAAGCATSVKGKRYKIKRSVVKMVNAIDTKQWDVARAQFADQVFVDYSSMSGQPGAMTASKDLVDGWQTLLAKVDTHHMLTNFEMSSDGKRAEVFSHVYASHTAKGIKYWDIYGRYHHKLIKTDDGWKINFMKLLVHGQKGNTKFLQQVSQQ
ncbi:MAG: nuclear transport factor 2 family protein [Pseudomonadota bacterium]